MELIEEIKNIMNSKEKYLYYKIITYIDQKSNVNEKDN